MPSFSPSQGANPGYFFYLRLFSLAFPLSYNAGNTKTKGGIIAVLLTSCLTGLDQSVFQIKTKIVSCHTADSKPVKQGVNGTVILPPFSIPCTVSPLIPHLLCEDTQKINEYSPILGWLDSKPQLRIISQLRYCCWPK